MKEKNKKILKVLGVGALACVGMVGLTGCSVDLTQEQTDKIMYTVDNSDKFMQETLDLLEKQNMKLNAEQAWNLYQLAETRLFLNDNDIRENFKITLKTVEGGEVVEYENYYYKTSNGKYVLAGVGESEHYIIFEQEGIVYDYDFHSERGTTKRILGEGLAEKYFYYEFSHVSNYDCSKENIIGCDILDNGNYQITFITTWSDAPEQYLTTSIIKLEISPDAKMISGSILRGSHILNNGQGDQYYEFEEANITYEYNTITDEDVLWLLEEAKATNVTE